MVNFGPLAAEIVSLVWGTPGNFNGFRVLAVVGVSQTAALNRGRHLYFGRAAITLGIGPHFLSSFYFHAVADCMKTLFKTKLLSLMCF